MAAPACAAFSSFLLVNFQGHVLDLANNVNPVISQTKNPTLTANQHWGLAPVNGGHFVLASGLSGAQGAVVVSWAASAGTTSPLFMQALAAPFTGTAFQLDCVNSTSASFIDGATGLALTAWPVESGSTISPNHKMLSHSLISCQMVFGGGGNSTDRYFSVKIFSWELEGVIRNLFKASNAKNTGRNRGGTGHTEIPMY
ncbi:hypothetical protein B0H13DRAFT_1890783 [Mycena leptocephala]|nr:hypothetical protein B0H13DRAFT_1890783 [Mycena leptocephala]